MAARAITPKAVFESSDVSRMPLTYVTFSLSPLAILGPGLLLQSAVIRAFANCIVDVLEDLIEAFEEGRDSGVCSLAGHITLF